MRPVRRLLVPLATAGVLALAGCGGSTDSTDPKDQPMSTSTEPISTAAASGALLCDFVSQDSVEALTGADPVAQGQVDRDNAGAVSGALCQAKPQDADGTTVRVNVVYSQGFRRDDFDQGLRDASYTQLPDSEGLGFTYAADGGGHARLAQGDYLVEADVDDVEGRDAQKDAAALARQAVATLKLPDRWTLSSGKPPTR